MSTNKVSPLSEKVQVQIDSSKITELSANPKNDLKLGSTSTLSCLETSVISTSSNAEQTANDINYRPKGLSYVFKLNFYGFNSSAFATLINFLKVCDASERNFKFLGHDRTGLSITSARAKTGRTLG
jgi:hypothetical protein